MLTANKDGLIHLRDTYIDPLHLRRLQDLGYLRPGDQTNEDAVIQAVERFIADATFKMIEEQNEDPKPVKLRPDRKLVNDLERYEWLDDPFSPEAIAASIENAVRFAMHKRLHASDVAREHAITALVTQQQQAARNAPVTGYGAQIANATREMINRRAAE